MTVTVDVPRLVIVVVSPKGGNGKTTVAVNLAAALARHTPTILCDLDVHFGDVEYALRLHPVHRADQIIERFIDNPGADLDVLLTKHPSGISIMCSPNNPVTADEIDVTECLAVVDKLREMGRPMVIDTAAGLDEFTLGAIERATHTLLVTSTDVASVQAGRKLLETVAQLAMNTGSLCLVVNRSTARSGLTVADVEAVLGLKATIEIPENTAIAAATNDGAPLTESSVSSPVSRLFYALAGEMIGNPVLRKRSFWSLRGSR